MNNELVAFLSKFNSFTNEEIGELANLLTVSEVKRNTIIVREGQICNFCYFVLKGCLRQYINIDGNEKTTAFYTEQEAVNFFTSLTNQTPSSSYLCSLEDSTLLVGNPEKDAELYAKFPKLEQITRKMVEQDFGIAQDSFARFMTSSPEERYLHVLNERPELLQRVPQYQLASYLGMTPESLSRVRKRVMNSK